MIYIMPTLLEEEEAVGGRGWYCLKECY